MSTVGGNKQAVQKYIQSQEKEDLISKAQFFIKISIIFKILFK